MSNNPMAAVTLDVLTAQVRDAIWDALGEQVDMGYIDRDRGIIDTGMADNLDMDRVAEAAIKVMLKWIPHYTRIYPQL